MASDKDYLAFIEDQLSELEGITHRPMMGEFILYYNGKIIGGIYDNRFLLKQTPAGRRLMPEAVLETPYPGAKEMLLVDNVDDRKFLKELIHSTSDDLPSPKKKTKKKDAL